MIKINANDLMGVAWMLAWDGTAYPVKVHVYGAPGDLAANIGAGLWLNQVKPIANLTDFFKACVGYYALENIPYSEDEMSKDEFDDFMFEVLADELSGNGNYVGMSDEQVAEYLLSLVSNLSVDEIYDLGTDIDENSGDFINADINEQFIRVRLNNEYNEVGGSGNGVCFFRIGSVGKDWTDQIYMFVSANKRIKSVIVERDSESDFGTMNRKGNRNVLINNMPREEFLSARRLPMCASKRTAGINGMILKVLSNGGSYSDMMTVKANSSRILDAYDRLRREEIKLSYTNMTAPWATIANNRRVL
jgi:hypothetical protein